MFNKITSNIQRSNKKQNKKSELPTLINEFPTDEVK